MFHCSFHSWSADFQSISIGTQKFKLEVATTPKELDKGLMYRRKLQPKTGMIFFFETTDRESISMWMKHTYIPLDMLFINSSGNISCIHKNTIPHSLKYLTCEGSTMAVIEINAGEAEKYHILVGEHLKLPTQIPL